MLDHFCISQFGDVFFLQFLDAALDEFVGDQDGKRHCEVRNAWVPVHWLDQFPEELEHEDRAEPNEEDDIVANHLEDHVFVNLDTEVKTAANGVQLGDFWVLHGDWVSNDEEVQVKFPLFVGGQQTQSHVEDGEVPDSAVEDGTVNEEVVVTEEECEEKTDGEEGVGDVSGWLDLEMAVDVKCEEKGWRRVDFFGDEDDEMLLNLLDNWGVFHMELSNNYLEIVPTKW